MKFPKNDWNEVITKLSKVDKNYENNIKLNNL